ncbi:HAD-IA family hydrolase [Candidatus Woesearchaeota archaeon]|nr:HAD-IA family hydrolase [Candidatus Woesearchaeota archaeon]
MKNIKAIIFDFDGVINNGVEIHYDFYRDLCKAHDIKPPFVSKEAFREWFDPREYRTNYKNLGISLKNSRNLNYTEYIKRTGIPLIAGITEIIAKLSKKYTLAIVSTNHKEIIEHQLEDYGLLKFFKVIIGNGDVFKIKPNPEALLKCLKKLKLSHKEVIYIGDMVSDVETARNANIRIISVTWGWSSKEELKKSKPDLIIDNPKELLKLD